MAPRHGVDEGRAAVELPGEALARRAVLGEHGAAEPERRRVGQLQRVLRVARHDERRHGAEQLLVEGQHAARDAAEHRRRVVVAGAVGDLPAGEHLGALVLRLLDLVLELLPEVRAGERAEVGAVGHRVADGERRHLRHEALGERLVDVLVDDEALGGDAALAVVLRPRVHRLVDGEVEVGVGEDDEGVAAAELQHARLEGAAGLLGHGAAGAPAAGERDARHAVVGDDGAGVVGGEHEVLEEPVAEAGLFEQLRDGLAAAEHVRRVLEDHPVAGGERGHGGADGLPEGEVPRHDGQDHAERLVRHERALGRRLARLILQKRLGVLGDVAAQRGALLGLGLGLSHGLSHLGRHQLRVAAGAGVERVGEAAEGGGALGVRGGGVAALGLGGGVERAVELARLHRSVGLDGLLGGGVDRGKGGHDGRGQFGQAERRV